MAQGDTTRAASLAGCYKHTGIFFCADYLHQRGIKAPSRVVTLVGRCLLDTGHLFNGGPRGDAGDCIKAGLDSVLAQANPPESVERLDLLWSYVNDRAPWDGYTDFAELLNARCGPQAYEVARRRLIRRGFVAPIELLHDLAVGFVDRALPRAVRTFNLIKGEGHEVHWLATVFYRYALRSLLVQRSSDYTVATLLHAQPNMLATDVMFEQAERERLQAAVRGAVDGLDQTLARPLRLYFGFEQPESSIRNIARRMGTSDYRVRVLLVRGLAAVAARAEVHSVLDARELDVARAMFIDRLDETATATHLKLRERQVKGALSSLQSKLGIALRETRSPNIEQRVHDMTNTCVVDPATILKEILAGAEVSWSLDKSGRREVVVTRQGTFERWVVEPQHLLQHLSQSPELAEQLERADIDLGWLIAPASSRERTDRPPDFDMWARCVDELSDTARSAATRVYESWTEELEQRGLSQRLSEDESIDRIGDTLAGVVAGLEEKLPRAGRREGRAILEFIPDESPSVRWIQPEKGEVLGFRPLVRFAIGIAGGLSHDTADVLVDVVVSSLQDVTSDHSILGYRLIDSGTSSIQFEWVSPRLDLRSAQFSSTHGVSAGRTKPIPVQQ